MMADDSNRSCCTDDEGSEEIERQLHEDVLLYLQEHRYRPECTKNEKRSIRRKAVRYTFEDGALLYTKQDKTKVRYILDLKEKERILQGCHVHPTSGHMGSKRTLARITERYMWQGVGKDVKAFVKECDVCQRMTKKMDTGVPELNPIPVVATWYHIGIDFIGPLKHKSTQGNTYILTVSDYFSKFVQAFACRNKESSTVFSALFKLFMQFGLPRVITSDQGSEFNNRLDKKLMKMMKIDHRLTTPYHPQANGLVERFNQTIQSMLVKFVIEKKEHWEDYLDTCVFAYNTSKHESSKYCPFTVMFGRQALLPVEIQSPKGEDIAKHLNDNDEVIEQHFMHQNKVAQIVKENILTAQKRQKQAYDRKHHNPATFKVGALVLRKDMKRKKRAGGKMDFKWQGPYKVVKSVGKGIFQILNTNDCMQTLKVHGTHLKLFYPPKKATGYISTSHNASHNSDSSTLSSGKGSFAYDPSAIMSDKEPNLISQFNNNIKTDKIDNMSVVTHTPKFHSPTLCNTRMSIITYEPSATMSDKDSNLQLCNEDTKITNLNQMDEDNKSVVNYGPKLKSDDQSDCSLNVARVSISYDPSTTLSDKEPSHPSLISQWDEEDFIHCKDLERRNTVQAHNRSQAIEVNCPVDFSSPKQAGGYFPEFGSRVLSPISSQKLECNKIKPESAIKGKRIVDMIFSPPKHVVCKRKLNFSDSPDATLIKPLRRRKLIKGSDEFQKNTETKPPTTMEPAPIIATNTVTKESKITATSIMTNVIATTSTAETGMMNTTGAKNKSVMPLTAYNNNALMGEMKCTDESKQPDKPRSSSQRVSKICQSKHKWLLEAKIGKYKLYDISIISLARKNEWVADEVITAYIHFLVNTSNMSERILVVDNSVMNKICKGKFFNSDRKLIKLNIQLYDYAIGAFLQGGNHWVLLCIDVKTFSITYVDPKGEKNVMICQLEKYWRNYGSFQYMEGNWGKPVGKWRVITKPHCLQRDDVSCGVFVMKYAECIIMQKTLPLAVTSSDLYSLRQNMAVQLLDASESLQRYCRACGTCNTNDDDGEDWIRCDLCDWWFHMSCVNKNCKGKKYTIREAACKNFCGPCCSNQNNYEFS